MFLAFRLSITASGVLSSVTTHIDIIQRCTDEVRDMLDFREVGKDNHLAPGISDHRLVHAAFRHHRCRQANLKA
jgi:hypothetical protein